VLSNPVYSQVAEILKPPTAPDPNGQKYGITGTVINSLTGEPIRRAVVSTFPQAEQATLTDGEGRFEFVGLPEGRVTLGVYKPGFFSEQEEPFQQTLQVGPGSVPVVLKIAPSGVILGRVTTREGEPIPEMQVEVIPQRYLGGRKMWFSRQYQASTDENGDFRIAYLPPATYHVAVDQSQETALGQPGIPNATEEGFAQVFYPGVSDFRAATALELHAAEELVANFKLTPEPFYAITGILKGNDKPPASLVVTRQLGEASDFTQNVSVQNARFQTKLPGGSYIVRGFTATGVALSTIDSPVVIDSDNAAVPIVLASANPIPVVLRTEISGATARNVDASADNGTPSTNPQDGTPGVMLQLVANTPFFNRAVNRSSRYTWTPQSTGIENVEPGVYEVQINTMGAWRVKSVQYGNVNLLSNDLTITTGIQPAPIEVTLRDDAAAASGTVLHADGNDQPTVLLVQPHSSKNWVRAIPTNAGAFQIQGISPGDYLLLAFDQADKLEYEDPDVLNPYLSGAAHITLQPHGTASINLTLSPKSR